MDILEMEQLVPMSTSVSLALIDSSPPKMAAKVKSAQSLFRRALRMKLNAGLTSMLATQSNIHSNARARWKLDKTVYHQGSKSFCVACFQWTNHNIILSILQYVIWYSNFSCYWSFQKMQTEDFEPCLSPFSFFFNLRLFSNRDQIYNHTIFITAVD